MFAAESAPLKEANSAHPNPLLAGFEGQLRGGVKRREKEYKERDRRDGRRNTTRNQRLVTALCPLQLWQKLSSFGYGHLVLLHIT